MAGKTFEELLHQSDKPVFVDFWAGWCAPCNSIAPSVKRLAEEFSGKLTVVKINVDKQPELAAKYQVQGIPALMLFNNGRIVWRGTGALPSHAMVIVQHCCSLDVCLKAGILLVRDHEMTMTAFHFFFTRRDISAC